MTFVRQRPWLVVVWIGVAMIGAYSILYVAHLLPIIVSQPSPTDWEQHRVAAERVASGESPYFVADWYRFRWHPIGAWLMVIFTAPGAWLWTVAQFAVLITLPVPMALLTLVAFPFWADVQAGNVMTFTFVAAYHALRGNRWGGAALVVLALLVPRPLVLPLVAYLSWKHRGWRLPIALAIVISMVAAALTGLADEWIGMLLLTAGEESHRVGAQLLPGWPVAGVVIAGALVAVGYPALAGFALQPYWLPYYGTLPLLELRRVSPFRQPPDRDDGASG